MHWYYWLASESGTLTRTQSSTENPNVHASPTPTSLCPWPDLTASHDFQIYFGSQFYSVLDQCVNYLYWWAFFKMAAMFGCRCWCRFLLPAIAICSILFFFCMLFEFMIDVHYGFIGQLMWQLQQLQQSLSSFLCSSVECLILYTAQSYYRGGTGSVGGSLLGCEETPSACGQFLSCHLAGTLPCCLWLTARWQSGHLGLFYWWQRCPLISDRFICCRSRCRFTDVYRCWIPVSCWMSQSMVTIQFALLNVFQLTLFILNNLFIKDSLEFMLLTQTWQRHYILFSGRGLAAWWTQTGFLHLSYRWLRSVLRKPFILIYYLLALL